MAPSGVRTAAQDVGAGAGEFGRRRGRGRVAQEVVVRVANWIMLPAMPNFLGRHQQLRVNPGAGDRPAHLIEEGLHCTIRGGPLPQSGLAFRPLREVHFGPHAAPAWLRRNGTAEHPSALEDLQPGG